jgi:acyl-CoA reductase-like NAD-dependent aldehyde dehydrogenase
MIDLFINGKRHKSSSGETRNIIHPSDGSVVEVAQEATKDDVEKAIKSARIAFDSGPWPKTTNAHRSSVLKLNQKIPVKDLLKPNMTWMMSLKYLSTLLI